jgi:recombinational DNA repair protein RecR
MSQELSGIVVSASQIQTILKRLMRQQPDNVLLATAFNIAEHIDEVAEDLLWSTPEGAA